MKAKALKENRLAKSKPLYQESSLADGFKSTLAIVFISIKVEP